MITICVIDWSARRSMDVKTIAFSYCTSFTFSNWRVLVDACSASSSLWKGKASRIDWRLSNVSWNSSHPSRFLSWSESTQDRLSRSIGELRVSRRCDRYRSTRSIMPANKNVRLFSPLSFFISFSYWKCRSVISFSTSHVQFLDALYVTCVTMWDVFGSIRLAGPLPFPPTSFKRISHTLTIAGHA